MHFYEFKNLVEGNTTKFQKVSLTISESDNPKEIIDFFIKNKLEITEFELEFEHNIGLPQRSNLLVELEIIFIHINGLKNLKINTTFLDKPLKVLLLNEAVLTLESLEFSRINLNSVDLFEGALVRYLQKNTTLKELIINNSDITSEKYPNLRSALIEHPSVNNFSQGFGVLNSKEKGTNLERDPYVLQAFSQKLQKEPTVYKARCEFHFQKIIQEALRISKNLDDHISLRKATYPDQNAWLETLNSFLIPLVDVLKELTLVCVNSPEWIENLEGKKEYINALLEYATLIYHHVYLQGHLRRINPLTPHVVQDELDQFWETKRISLLDTIQRIENNDYSEVLKEIQYEKKKLEPVFNRLMVAFFPASYKALTTGITGGLEQAKRLLVDYTKDDSTLSRIFHGHWNRHHVAEVNTIVKRINSKGANGITNVDDLMAALNEIKLCNPEGSLSRRMQFISLYCQNSAEPEIKQELNIKL